MICTCGSRLQIETKAGASSRKPRISPLVVKYIGELRAEVQEKYGITFEKHLAELAKLRDDSAKKGVVNCN